MIANTKQPKEKMKERLASVERDLQRVLEKQQIRTEFDSLGLDRVAMWFSGTCPRHP
jgi:hypothetical protein